MFQYKVQFFKDELQYYSILIRIRESYFGAKTADDIYLRNVHAI